LIRTLRELWRYRELARILVAKEMKLRYRRSVLGFAWTMLNPLVTMVILTIVFSNAMRIPVDKFPVFLLSALLPWNFFAQSLTGGSQSIIYNESLLKNVYAPRTIFPIALVLSHLVNLLLALVPLLLVMLWQGAPFGPGLLALPLCLAFLGIFTIGIVLATSTWTVFFRDLSQILEVGLQALFYLVPIIYPLSVVPERFAPFFRLNPLLHLVTPFRTIFYEGAFPDATSLAVGGTLAVAAFTFGLAVFRRHEAVFLHYLS
jgi:ABC-type polysaccharide/polyol phosphate export permease